MLLDEISLAKLGGGIAKRYVCNMKRILIIGNSGGIGAALETEYLRKGWLCTGIARRAQGLDFKRPETISSALAVLDETFATVIIATGALTIGSVGPEKTIRAVTGRGMADQMQVNAIGPALILSQIGRLLPRDQPARVAVLSARVGSIGDNRLGGWISYRAAKAALNQIVHTSAIELSRSHPLLACFSLHPGTVETPLTKPFVANHSSLPASQAAVMLHEVIEAREACDTGEFFDQNGLRVPW